MQAADSKNPRISESLPDLDNASLYQPAGRRSETTMAIPKPRDEQDWLAVVPEEAQTFDDYTDFLLFKNGKYKPNANVSREEIVLLPVIGPSTNKNSGTTSKWLSNGVPLEPLVALMERFYHRPV
jgi:hypothetical protein